ncbi:origin recognition complex subunit 5 C-terminus-domain-containing protein [Sphaerosporella brunnea]|uniref:Origin recognition complex subunit 5 C-terminus-domain-containing protein n=1 Tax=Sphaerosporella brunnea TaxID=1250544 RepID=A0A5J5EKU2_9PEZI|nr:origin recognition complex subunit 5 C-terminus-domain-containing protein [Sphaerosporella brunnea]
MLPAGLLQSIDSRYPCRTTQLAHLSVLIGDDSSPSPSAFVVHGLEATGKTLILKSLLEDSNTSYSWLPCHECITARHLTERIAATVSSSLGASDSAPQRCENVSTLIVYLQNLLRASGRKHFLVLDRIDRQREPPPTLFASLRRMGEMIDTLTVIFMVSAPHPRFFSSAEIPHVHFPPYSKDESIEILCKNPLPIERIPTNKSDDEDDSDEEEIVDTKTAETLWRRYCTSVWDSLARGAARDIVRFRTVAEKNWEPFVRPVARGEYDPKNYSGLVIFQKVLFQRETALIDRVIPPTINERTTIVKSHDLPYYSKFLLCAAYLASYNPARLDFQLFTKGNDGKKRKRGGGQKRQASTRKIQRQLLGPQAFPIERLLAIFPVIVPETIQPSVDIQAQIATLTSLRLLVKATSLDPLDGSSKWKVNVGREYIRAIAFSINFDIEDYMTE